MAGLKKLKRVWIENETTVETTYDEVTDQVKVVCNLLADTGPDKSSHYYATCKREAELLLDRIEDFETEISN